MESWIPFFEKVSLFFSFFSEKSFVKGFKRRFWQKSTDHRGTDEYPGRTVTIIRDDNSKCYGMSFLVDQDKENLKELISQLDFREKCGYSREEIIIFDEDNKIITERGTIYIGKEDNVEFVANENIIYTSYVISRAIGPTKKKNSEYLYNLGILNHLNHSFIIKRIKNI